MMDNRRIQEINQAIALSTEEIRRVGMMVVEQVNLVSSSFNNLGKAFVDVILFSSKHPDETLDHYLWRAVRKERAKERYLRRMRKWNQLQKKL